MRNLAEKRRPVEAIPPATNGSALAGDYISLKNVSHVTAVVHITQGNAAPCAITIEQATAVAGTNSKVITEAVPIFANQDCAASDLIVEQTKAVNFTTSATLKHKIVVFEIDPATLDTNNGFDCLTVKVGASNAANIVSAQYFVNERYYNQSVIVD